MKKLLMLICFSLLSLSYVYAQTTTTQEPSYTTIHEETSSYPRLELQGEYWYPDLRGHVHVYNTSHATDVKLPSDIGLDKYSSVPSGSISWDINPTNSIRASYLYFYDRGSTTLSQNITFGGHSYTAATPIDSSLRVQYYSLGWLWDFFDNERLKSGFVLDLKGINVRGKVAGAGTSTTQRMNAGAPTIGLRLKYNLVRDLNVFGEAEGIPAGHYGYFFDARAGLCWEMTRNVSFSAGYRMVDIKAHYQANDGHVDLQGPFAALTLKF